MIANDAIEQPELAEGGKRSRWIWLGWMLLVIAACLHSANRPIGGGDTWVAMANGRYTVGPWAMEDEGRTWQMRVLDKFGVHLTKKDYMVIMKAFKKLDGSGNPLGKVELPKTQKIYGTLQMKYQRT